MSDNVRIILSLAAGALKIVFGVLLLAAAFAIFGELHTANERAERAANAAMEAAAWVAGEALDEENPEMAARLYYRAAEAAAELGMEDDAKGFWRFAKTIEATGDLQLWGGDGVLRVSVGEK